MTALIQKQKTTLVILGAAAVLLLSTAAIMTAILLQRKGIEPVVPSVPQSKPKAVEVTPSPVQDNASRKTWIITSDLTPTLTLIPSLTPTAAATLKPTGVTTTPIPTVAQQSLPQAGGVLPTIGAAVGGLGIILLGLLLIL